MRTYLFSLNPLFFNAFTTYHRDESIDFLDGEPPQRLEMRFAWQRRAISLREPHRNSAFAPPP